MINTYSAFIYGHTINNSNFYFGIDEGSGEILAELNPSAYSLTDFVTELGRALNSASEINNNYNVTLDRATRTITISADSNFSILTTTSSQVETSAYLLVGFTSNKSGSNSYIADTSSGSIYYPQYKLQKYVDFEDQVGSLASVNNSPADGSFIEVINYGQEKMMEGEIKWITDLDLGKDSLIKENLTGVQDARDFMNYIISGAPIEFIPDELDFNTFTKCLLVKTPEDSKGRKFKLKEDRQWRNTFTTGLMKFRETI